MAYSILRASAADRDLELIFDHLVDSYQLFGDPLPNAFYSAVQRVEAIQADMDALALAPHQGTLRNDLRPGLRHVTKNKAIFYFEVDEAARVVRVLAIFFGGQDHQRRMLVRLGKS